MKKHSTTKTSNYSIIYIQQITQYTYRTVEEETK